MASNNLGVLGGFSGKLGNVVGYYRNGKFFLRPRVRQIHDAKSAKQLGVREKFLLINRMAKGLRGVIGIGFGDVEGMSAGNYFFRVNYRGAVSGDYPNVSVDWKRIAVSEGDLATAKGLLYERKEGEIDLEWTDNSGAEDAEWDDRLVVGVYDMEREEGCWKTAGMRRKDGKARVRIPGRWGDERVGVYCFFVKDKDGRRSETMWAQEK
jgi:hypothetical protein